MTKKHATSRSKRNNKTKRRSYTRRRSRSRSYGNRRTGVKRGGMLHATKRAMVARLSPELRTLLYHEIIPLLTQYGHYVHSSKLDPSHKSMVIHGEKHFNSPFPAKQMYNQFKTSLNDAIKEGQDPVKTGEKLITLYGKVKQALEEEEIKRKRDTHEFIIEKTPPPFTIAPSSLISASSINTRTPLPYTPLPGNTPAELIHQPFTRSPNESNISNSSNSGTSRKLRSKHEINVRQNRDKPDNILNDYGPTARLDFTDFTPPSSPTIMKSPPPPSSTNPENKENELFTSPVKSRLILQP